MFFRLLFVTLVFVLIALGTPVKRDSVTVEADIKDIGAKVQSLDSSVEALPSNDASVTQVLAIHQAALELSDTIQKATNDAKDTPAFTDSLSSTILSLLGDISPLIKKSLSDLVAKKSAISADHVAAIAKSDLQLLRNDTDTYGKALVNKSPADTKKEVQSQFNDIGSNFASAIGSF